MMFLQIIPAERTETIIIEASSKGLSRYHRSTLISLLVCLASHRLARDSPRCHAEHLVRPRFFHRVPGYMLRRVSYIFRSNVLDLDQPESILMALRLPVSSERSASNQI